MMERPKREYAENCTLIHTYARELEEYCDYLEAIISKGDCVSHYEKEIQRLEKALDKACELIKEAVSQDCTIFDEVIEEEYIWRTEIYEWKEWLMKDGEIK